MKILCLSECEDVNIFVVPLFIHSFVAHLMRERARTEAESAGQKGKCLTSARTAELQLFR